MTSKLRTYFREVPGNPYIHRKDQSDQPVSVYQNLFCEPERLSRSLQFLREYADLDLELPIADVPDYCDCITLMDALSEIRDLKHRQRKASG